MGLRAARESRSSLIHRLRPLGADSKSALAWAHGGDREA